MSSAQYLYRRDSGIYFVRLCVPARLKQAVGKGEIHRSTACRDFRLAKIVAAEIAAHWHRAIEAIQGMDPAKIKAGSISLLGSGFVGLEKAASDLGADPVDLVKRLLGRGAQFVVEARDWAGWALASMHDDADYEHDEFGRAAMVLPPRDGRLTSFSGRLRLRHDEEVVQVAAGAGDVCQFFHWPSQDRGFVVDLPGRRLRLSDLQVEREHVEALRASIAGQLTSSPENANVGLPCADGGMHFSDLAREFLKRNGPSWKQDQRDRKAKQCGMFEELMGDPALTAITRPLMRQFSDKVARLPAELARVKRRFQEPDASFRRLIELADENDLDRLSADAHRRVLDGLSEVFNWAVDETYMAANPGKRLGSEVQRQSRSWKKKDQDQRDAFTKEDLAAIFGVEWFRDGVGTATPQRTFHAYRPHYYWLPILALYCGGRLNELAQLHLSDIIEIEGIWCIDFNLDAVDKLDVDEADVVVAGDKSLKSINAHRTIPIHRHLLELGFVDYVQALRRAGRTRVFEELHFDARKGYGKAAGSWFNERFLGKRLGIERNGRKTFHSLRHNFATALGAAQVPLPIKSDLMGHSRSDALVEARYDKGAELAKLRDYVNTVSHPLPPIGSFAVEAGLDAVSDALRLKIRHGKRSE